MAIHVASEFFVSLFGPCPDGLLILWDKETRRSRFTLFTEGFDTDVRTLVESSRQEHQDLYFGSCLQKEALAKGRGKRSSCSVMGGVWIDIDFAGSVGKSERHYPTLEQVIGFIHGKCPVPPTAILETGGGFHLWWLLVQSWTFQDDGERDAAEQLVRQLQDFCRRELGRVDGTHDLTRVMRFPGSYNSRSDFVCRWLDGWDIRETMPRYSVVELSNEFRASGKQVSYAKKGATGSKAPNGPSRMSLDLSKMDVSIDFDQLIPASVELEEKGAPQPNWKVTLLIENSPDFARVWERKRRLPSQSEYDLAIASHMVGAGATDQEVAQAILCHRIRGGEAIQKVSDRKDYLLRTIGRARFGQSQDVRALLEDDTASERPQEPRVSTPADNGDPSTEAAEPPFVGPAGPVDDAVAKIRQHLGRAFGTGPIRRILKVGTDRPVYSIELEDGRSIRLGRSDEFTVGSRLELAILDATSVYPELPRKREGRIKLFNQMMRIMEWNPVGTSLAELCRTALFGMASQCESSYDLDQDSRIIRGRPVLRDGRLFFQFHGLLQVLSKSYSCNVTQADLALALEHLRVEKRRLVAKKEHKEIRRNYYNVEIDHLV